MGGLTNEPIPDSHIPQTEGLQTGDHRCSTSSGDDLVFDLVIGIVTDQIRGSW